MLETRIIPCLLIDKNALVKSIKFKNKKYIGDPINTVRIFNEQEVDEIIFLDISAGIKHKEPNFKLIKQISVECFMPFSYGGGITTFEQAKKIFSLGVEKISINSAFNNDIDLIKRIIKSYGSQSLILSLDVKKNIFGKYQVFTCGGTKRIKGTLHEYLSKIEKVGVGEILLNSINNDGKMTGYDTELIRLVSDNVSVPVIACGGAGRLEHLNDAIKDGHASAVATGSMVIYQGFNRSVLINFPNRDKINEIFK